MKKIGILTIIDNDNYGNRLQNYAITKIISIFSSTTAITLNNREFLNDRKYYFLRKMKYLNSKDTYSINLKRKMNFMEFNNYINFNQKELNPFVKYNNFDFVLCGSDQVWNPNFGRLRDADLLCFVKPDKRIAFSASFGVNDIPENMKNRVGKALKKFKAISVREDAGKKIVEELTGRTDVEVLVDPTMLLTDKEWDEVSKKPKMLKSDKYILNYFLGDLSDARKNEINRVAKENGCKVINILDKESQFYECGPSEFLYLEKHAFLICTDSFHSSVFGILYNTPFLVFEREDNNVSMNSRLDTLFSKFKLENRKYKGKISNEDLKCDYTEAYKILEIERDKSIKFLKNALDIKDSDTNE